MSIPHSPAARQKQVMEMLRQLNAPPHRIGYYQLMIGIPRYAENPAQSATKDLYPYVAQHCGRITSQAVEHSIRELIRYSWRNRKAEIWEQYFPGFMKAPSNKQFIATLASRLR